jgi:hypothetical protein
MTTTTNNLMRVKLTVFVIFLCLAVYAAAQTAEIYGPQQGGEISAPVTYDNTDSTLKLIRRPADQRDAVADVRPPAAQAPNARPAVQTAPDAPPQSDRAAVPPAQHLQSSPSDDKKSARPRDKVRWNKRLSGNFTVYSQPRTQGVPTPNLNLKFETVYQILRKNIQWLVAGRSDVYVYQAKADFLKYEPRARSWSGAMFVPDDNCIVMYDDTKDSKNLISQFTHELTHLFFEDFFNPPAGKAAYAEPPIWLNEGLAVNMEDISANYRGGVWANDLILYNIYPPSPAAAAQKQAPRLQTSSGRVFGSGSALGARDGGGYAGGPRLSDKRAVFKDFRQFIRQDSIDNASAGGWVDDWYFQAYAMVRFLFKPYNAQYPENRLQFEQLLKEFNASRRADSAAVEAALKKAYGYKDIADFETRFYRWLYAMQKVGREKILRENK